MLFWPCFFVSSRFPSAWRTKSTISGWPSIGQRSGEGNPAILFWRFEAKVQRTSLSWDVIHDDSPNKGISSSGLVFRFHASYEGRTCTIWPSAFCWPPFSTVLQAFFLRFSWVVTSTCIPHCICQICSWAQRRLNSGLLRHMKLDSLIAGPHHSGQ